MVASKSSVSARIDRVDGTRRMGHVSTHRPQRMHWCDTWRSAPTSTSTPLVPLVTGTSSVRWARPIMGPPLTILFTSGARPHASISARSGAPTRQRKLAGRATPAPVTVTTRSISGRPYRTASVIACAVPTF